MNNEDEDLHPLAPLRLLDARSGRRTAQRKTAVYVALLTLAALLAAAWFVVPVLAGGGSARAETSHGQDAADGTAGQGVRNGEIPRSELVEIGDGYVMVSAAARAYQEMATALHSAGHTVTISSAYRSREEQEAVVERYGLLEDGGRAAPVGESEHGLGTAVDLAMDYDAVDWLREHASDYGFAETIPEEPWHWAYVGR